MICFGLPLLFLGVCFGSPVGVQKHRDVGSLLGGGPPAPGAVRKIGKVERPLGKGVRPGSLNRPTFTNKKFTVVEFQKIIRQMSETRVSLRSPYGPPTVSPPLNPYPGRATPAHPQAELELFTLSRAKALPYSADSVPFVLTRRIGGYITIYPREVNKHVFVKSIF